MKLLTKQIYEIYCLDNFDFDMIFTFCEVILEKNGIYVMEGDLDFMNEKGMTIKDIDENLKLITA